MNSQNSVNQK